MVSPEAYSPIAWEIAHEAGVDGSQFVSSTSITQAAQEFYLGALKDVAKRMHKLIEELSVCVLLDGPYGIPIRKQ